MKYLNIDLSTLRSPEYIGSAPTERGTWLSVLGYCADQENGGRIVGAMTWKDRQWQQVCGVTLREVRATTRLLLIEGDDVIVFDYPFYLEEEIRNRRASGRRGGQARTQEKTQASRENGAKHNPSRTQAEPKECLKQNPSRTQGVLEANTQAEPKQEPNVREGKVKEGKVSNTEIQNTEIQAPPAGDACASLELGLSTSFPEALNTESFKSVWTEWLAYRRECKIAKYKPRAMSAQLAMLAEWGPDAAIESIRQSIRQQWRGLFEPKNNAQGHLSKDAQQRSEELSKANGYEY